MPLPKVVSVTVTPPIVAPSMAGFTLGLPPWTALVYGARMERAVVTKWNACRHTLFVVYAQRGGTFRLLMNGIPC